MVLMATNDVKQQVFEREFLPALDILYRDALHLTNDEVMAEDLVHDTLELAIKSFDSYRQGTNAKAWLRTIMRNRFINDYRKRKRQPNRVDYDDVVGTIPQKETENIPAMIDWNDETLRAIVGDEVSAAMERLHPKYYEVIVLYDFQELKYEEVAAELNIPIGTVRSRLYRGRIALAKELKDYAEANGYNNNRI